MTQVYQLTEIELIITSENTNLRDLPAIREPGVDFSLLPFN